MNKKYLSSNKDIGYNLSNLTIGINPNYSNNKIYSYINSPIGSKYINFTIGFIDKNINDIKNSFYYSLEISGSNYIVTDYLGDYSILSFYYQTSDQTFYESSEYELIIDNESEEYDIKLTDKADNTKYYFSFNTNYPNKIEYSSGKTLVIDLLNNRINYIICFEEKIVFYYENNKIKSINLKKIINNTEIDVSKITINYISANNVKIYNLIQEYDSDLGYYVWNNINEIEISTTTNYIIFSDINELDKIKIYNQNGKINKLEEIYNNTINETIYISYNSNVVTINKNNKNTFLIYDSNNRFLYATSESRYINKYEYNSNELIVYESPIIMNQEGLFEVLSTYYENPIIEDDEEGTYYDMYHYHIYNDIIPPYLNGLIDINDTYVFSGYGGLYKNISKYGTEYESYSVLLFVKRISGSLTISFRYKNYYVSSTFINKTINSGYSEYEPVIIGLKPKYPYDSIEIELIVNGEFHLTSPRIIKGDIGAYYYYNSSNQLIKLECSSGDTLYTYNNGYISSIETKETIISYQRNYNGYVLSENENGDITTYTYDNKGNTLSVLHNNELVSYNYSYILEDCYYFEKVEMEKGYSTITIIKDLLGRTIRETSQINSINTIIDTKTYEYYKDNIITQLTNGLYTNYDYQNNKIIELYDNCGNRYNIDYQNKDISEVKYNNIDLEENVYDNKRRLIEYTFNGTYNYLYSDEKLTSIKYNNVIINNLSYDNNDRLISDGYNNYTYDADNQILSNEIYNKIFHYKYNDLNYQEVINNYGFNTIIDLTYTTKIGNHQLKNDNYYSNIAFNNNSNASLINSTKFIVVDKTAEYFPLSKNLLSTRFRAPNIFTKQDYNMFYYDKDINDYALLLYGLKIEYNTEIINDFYISLEIKLENRILNRTIMLLSSYANQLHLYVNQNNKILLKINNITYDTNTYISNNNWYVIAINYNSNLNKLELYLNNTKIKEISYSTLLPNLNIRLGEYDSYNPYTTFGLIRNLIVIKDYLEPSDLSDYYLSVDKIDSYKKDNNIISEEIKINNETVLKKQQESVEYENVTFDNETYELKIEKDTTYNSNNNYIVVNKVEYIHDVIIANSSYFNSNYNYNNLEISYDFNDKFELSKDIMNDINHQPIEISYDYDIRKNIISKITKNLNTNNLLETVIYSYDNVLPNRLNSITINNQIYPITYNNTGLQPISFMNNTYEYEGNRLVKYNDYNYEYNVKGLRIRKYSDNLETNIYYYYDKDNKLILENHLGSYDIRYLYDSNNEIYGFLYYKITPSKIIMDNYFYLKDKIGNIIGIVDSLGRLKGTYRYNSYGELLEIRLPYPLDITNEEYLESCQTIMDLNPIRYKSYYYDIESNMYYLRSRYYSPLLARFITPDSTEYLDYYDRETYNLYCYCNNNPVMYSDGDGTMPITATILLIGGLIAGGIGAGIGFGTAVYNDYKEDKKFFNGDWTDYVGRTLGGFVTGFGIGVATVLGAGVGAAALGGTTATLFSSTGLTLSMGSALGIGSGFAFATGMAGYTTRALISRREKFEVGNMFMEGGINAISGALSVLGGALGGYAGLHNTVFTKLLSQKGDLIYRILVENMFTVGFKILLAVLKAVIEG